MKTIQINLLRLGLVLGTVYQLYQTLYSTFSGHELSTIILNLLIALSFILLLYLVPLLTQWVAFLFHLVVLGAFVYFWFHTAGIEETVPDMMCLYFAFMVVVSSGYFFWIAFSAHLFFLITAMYFPSVYGSLVWDQFPRQGLVVASVEYGIVAMLIATFVGYMKRSFQSHHELVINTQAELHKVSAVLFEQNEELLARQEEIRVMNENLQAIIMERTSQIETKNTELSEYAFINAHMLRGPLSRIIGLTNLMECDPACDTEKVNEIRTLANNMDRIVREINAVIS